MTVTDIQRPYSVKLISSFTIALLLVTSNAVAKPDREDGRRHGPPQVALDACQTLSVGAACSFVGRRDNELKGQCVTTPDELLACLPEGHEARKAKRAQQDRR